MRWDLHCNDRSIRKPLQDCAFLQLRRFDIYPKCPIEYELSKIELRLEGCEDGAAVLQSKDLEAYHAHRAERCSWVLFHRARKPVHCRCPRPPLKAPASYRKLRQRRNPRDVTHFVGGCFCWIAA